MDSDLHNRLVKAGVLKPGAKSRSGNNEGSPNKILIDIEASQMFESGIAMAKYLISLREALNVRVILRFNKSIEKRDSRTEY